MFHEPGRSQRFDEDDEVTLRSFEPVPFRDNEPGIGAHTADLFRVGVVPETPLPIVNNDVSTPGLKNPVQVRRVCGDVVDMVDGIREEDDIDGLLLERCVIWKAFDRLDLRQPSRLRLLLDIPHPLFLDVQGIDLPVGANLAREHIAPEPIFAPDIDQVVRVLRRNQSDNFLAVRIPAEDVVAAPRQDGQGQKQGQRYDPRGSNARTPDRVSRTR